MPKQVLLPLQRLGRTFTQDGDARRTDDPFRAQYGSRTGRSQEQRDATVAPVVVSGGSALRAPESRTVPSGARTGHLPDSTATADELSAPALQEHLTQPVPLVLPQRPCLVCLSGHVRSLCASPDRRRL
jgi:hypothetical protein